MARRAFLPIVMVVGLASAFMLARLAEPTKAAVTLPAGFTDALVTRVPAPTALAFTPDGRMLITTQAGRLRVYQDGSLQATPALDLADPNADGDEGDGVVCSNSERGLLGIAVDPAFSTNHYIYVYYTFKKHGVCEQNTSGSPVNRVARYVLSSANIATLDRVLIDNIPSPNGNHNAGDLRFGKDGHLYVSVGDGGCDYTGNSGCGGANDATRDPHVLLGKILRITRNGNVPATNPYATSGDVCAATGRTTAGHQCGETFASGLRNPFRMAFDPNASGTRFFTNDVGQNAWEEVNLGSSGADYGWNLCEGSHDNPSRAGSVNCGASPYTPPVHEYDRSAGCSSITGGAFVPDGIWPEKYNGSYLFADYV